jgi:hypothetical protein
MPAGAGLPESAAPRGALASRRVVPRSTQSGSSGHSANKSSIAEHKSRAQVPASPNGELPGTARGTQRNPVDRCTTQYHDTMPGYTRPGVACELTRLLRDDLRHQDGPKESSFSTSVPNRLGLMPASKTLL